MPDTYKVVVSFVHGDATFCQEVVFEIKDVPFAIDAARAVYDAILKVLEKNS